jgi:hypothetical protein
LMLLTLGSSCIRGGAVTPSSIRAQRVLV